MVSAELHNGMFETAGFHGTSAEEAKGIIENGFNLVENQKLYLGDGAYFFIDGLSDPYQDALDYAMNLSKKENPVVVKADISAESESVLNLSSREGILLFKKFKERFYSKRIEDGKKMKEVDDGKIINCLVGEMSFNIKVVISMRCLRLKKNWIELNLHSFIPNCIYCCVKDKSCISNEQLIENGG